MRTLMLAAAIALAVEPGVEPGVESSELAYVTGTAQYRPIDYFAFLPPAPGASYVDPAFGTTITRISDALHTANAADVGTLAFIGNEYSTMTPFNADNSRLLLQQQSYFALYDGQGQYLRDLPFEITAASEPRWSRHDANVLYYVTLNQLKQFNTATGVAAPVRTFAEYAVINGRGESDICFDGSHLVLVGNHREVFVYDISTDTKGPVLATTALGDFDNVSITPDDHVLVSWYASGAGRYRGIELFDSDMAFLRQVSPVIGHMDVTRAADGNEVVLMVNAAHPSPPPGCANAIVKIGLAAGDETCLISLDWGLGAHVSGPDGNGWAIVSTYAWADPSPLASWARHAGEILQVKLDGSEVRRLAHHRSRPFNSYTWTPRASVSRDGARVVFSSNYGLPRMPAYHATYTDAYLIDLSSTSPAVAGSDDAIAIRVEQNAATAAFHGTWLPNSLAIHSGGNAMLTMEQGARVSFTFFGTGVRWLGFRDQWSGMATVSVDGQPGTTVDTFAESSQPQAVLFAASGLDLGVHTVVVEATGNRNPLAGGSWIWIDAFEVTVRVEQDDPAVHYSCPPQGAWYANGLSLHSKAGAALAMTPGCRASFTFTGSSVSWIGYRDEWSGIARVSIDGVVRGEIDTYVSPSAPRSLMYTLTGLSPGPHTLTIEPTGRWNPASLGLWVWVDAFEIGP